MKYAVRAVGLVIFTYAIVLSVELVWELHDGHYSISLGLALLALAVSATGLVLARYSWQASALPECGLGVALWLVGATFFGITELNYWSGSYTERHAIYTKHKAAEARQEGLKDKDWKALTTGEMPATPAEITAKISAAKMNERWVPSKGCTDATVPESKAFCSDYFALEAQLAAAMQREKLEKRLMASNANADTSLTFNVFAIADQLTRWFNIEERHATDIVVVTAWLLLMLCRDGGLLLAYPTGRREEAVVRVKPAIIPRQSYTPSLTLPAKPQAAITKKPEPTTPSPDPDDGGTPVAQPESKHDGNGHDKLVTAELYDFPSKEPPRSKKQRKHAIREKQDRERSKMIGDFVYECLDIESNAAILTRTKSGGYASGGTKGSSIYDSFVNWCNGNGADVIDRSPFGRIIKQYVDTAKAVKGVYYGAVICQHQRKKKVA